MSNKIQRQKFLLIHTSFLFLLMLFSVLRVEAADIDFVAPDELTLIEETTNDLNRIMGGTDVGTLTSKVYFDGFIYTYVLEVTPDFNSKPEFNMGESGTAIGGGYLNYGYDFDQANTAMVNGLGNNPSGSGNDIFVGTVESDNTIDWNLTEAYLTGDYYWIGGNTITFFFENSGEPVEGFYNFSAGLGSATANGFIPSPVPLPGAFLLMGSGMLAMGLIGRKNKFRNRS